MYNSPYVDPQLQLNQLASRYPQYFNQQNYNQPSQPYQNNGRVIFVTNIEEAKATPADMLGNPLFFYNKSKNEIYIKQTDATGAAPIREYELKKDQSVQSEIFSVEDKLQEIQKQLDEMHPEEITDIKKFENKIEELGYDLYDVEYSKEGPNYFLRIF